MFFLQLLFRLQNISIQIPILKDFLSKTYRGSGIVVNFYCKIITRTNLRMETNGFRKIWNSACNSATLSGENQNIFEQWEKGQEDIPKILSRISLHTNSEKSSSQILSRERRMYYCIWRSAYQSFELWGREHQIKKRNIKRLLIVLFD